MYVIMALSRGVPNLPTQAHDLRTVLQAVTARLGGDWQDVDWDHPDRSEETLQALLDSLHRSADINVQVALRARVDDVAHLLPQPFPLYKPSPHTFYPGPEGRSIAERVGLWGCRPGQASS